MQPNSWKLWAAAGLSAGLLELPFPLAGPLPPVRSVVAWFALAPLIWAVLRAAAGQSRPLRRSFLLGYAAGVLWFAGNCYWIYDTMLLHGGLPPVVSFLLLIAFSLVLGTYFGLFSLAVGCVRGRLGVGWALAAAPIYWAAQELAASRITSVPWDQLGYSQVDNAVVCALAPWTGVYGISFLLVSASALLAGGATLPTRPLRVASLVAGLALMACGSAGLLYQPPKATATATAVLVQPNLDVTADNDWNPADWDRHIAQFRSLANEQCKAYIAGIPQTAAPSGEIVCPPYVTHPDLMVWPEAPAPFLQADPRFQQAASGIAQANQAPLIVGGIGQDPAEGTFSDFNSAMIFLPNGKYDGRYDKIHLVPFGEYIPFKNLLTFAHKLTGRVSEFTRGRDRSVFRIVDQKGAAHRYGIFICYEAVFADEVRHLAGNGAEVLVNISDDGWYGDTSAPWQHLNMARMRAIENRRWLLRDTNNGVTAAIDPYGRVRQSIPRHAVDALPAEFGFVLDVTFYSRHGDVFAWCCAILSIGILLWAMQLRTQAPVQAKVRS